MVERPDVNDKMNNPAEDASFRDPNEPTSKTAFPVVMIVAAVVFIGALVAAFAFLT